MSSAKQDYREATALVFFEVCLDSVQAESTYGDTEAALIDRVYTELARAWRPINARRVVDPQMLVSRHRGLAKALRMVWPERRVDGRTAAEVVNKVVEAHACSTWKELRAELNRHGHLFHSGASWPKKMWGRAKRKVLDGTTWGLRTEPAPRTHTEAVARMLREFGGPDAKA